MITIIKTWKKCNTHLVSYRW